ncbi:MAG: class A beta-lactamase-related serine hydrolase [Immundisolibacterales bacterium]|nr:class A beta-lactamase-related serine hydrolase [Immundisolibacterales bacterium]
MSVDWTILGETVDELGGSCDIGVSVISPRSETWSRQGDVRFPSASTAKIPIMIEVYRMLDRGEIGLDDLHRLRACEKSRGSGVLRFLHAGLELSLADLLHLMMSISDNTATNILIELAGMDRINATMQSLGMNASILGRPMVGRLAIEGEQENLATPDDYTRAVAAIVKGEAASTGACQAMLATLERQQNARRIGRHVPTGGTYRWGSKTGTNAGIVNDVGFVAGPVGTMLIAVYCRGTESEVAGEEIVAGIARTAMRATGIV